MKKTTLSAFTALFVAAFSLALQVPCFAAPYKSAQYGYSLVIPDDWKQIPQDVIDRYTKLIQKPDSPNPIRYEAGFQPNANKNWLEHPYILVQVISYARLNQARQVDEDEFPQIIKQITGVDMRKVADEKMSDEAKKIVKDMAFTNVRLDTPNRRFSLTLNANVQGIGDVRGRLVGYFGRESLVQIGYYAKAEGWDAQLPLAQKIVDSFQFDREKAYSTEEAASHSIWKGVGEKATTGAITGGLIGLGIYGVSKLKKKSA